MKNIRYIILMAMAAASVACSDFLEQKSQDLIRPMSVEHYKELLQGEGYFKDFYKLGWNIDVMTDDIMARDPQYANNVINASVQFLRTSYCWEPDLETPEEYNSYEDALFKMLYKNVLVANICLDAADEAEGSKTERDVLKAQASFNRAYAYFVLANLYAKPYNEADPDDLCVPKPNSTTPSTQKFPRATISEIWDLIWSDIQYAVDILEADPGRNSRTYYEINYKAALILGSRIALYMGKYDKVIEFGEKYLADHSALFDISDITLSPNASGAGNGTTSAISFLKYTINPEISFTFSNKSASGSTVGSYYYYTSQAVMMAEICIGVSNDVEGALMNTYETGDRRATYWFSPPTGQPGGFLVRICHSPMKYNGYDANGFSQCMRTGEVYLNLAEAYMKQSTPDPDNALSLINELRRNRIAAANYAEKSMADFTGNDGFIKFIMEERRRELCFEEFHRWWDLRRSGMPALTHKWLDKTYNLMERDSRYVLNFPKTELDFSEGVLIPNNRAEGTTI